MFRTPVRFKHKARDRGIAVAMARERNAVIGAHRRSLQLFIVAGRGCPRPWTGLRRVARATAIAGATRLAPDAGSLAEQDKYTLKEH